MKTRARELGFATAGITDLSAVPHADALDTWLAAGYAGTMRYMQRQADRRKHPSGIVRGATRCVVVSYNYYRDDAPTKAGCGKVARYAHGVDYHQGLAPALRELADAVVGLGDANSFARVYVDAGPVPERELAQRAGLGWIGKNTMLIDPRRGSYTFLAVVLTNVELAIDAAFEADRCGSCRRCLDACPTNAFPAPRMLDATRCISYLTIEYQGPFPTGLAGSIGEWAFGCDVCQDVCPWNQKFARADDDRWLGLDRQGAWIPVGAFAALDEAGFHDQYGDTALARPGLEGMRRNAAAVARNLAEDSHD